jgi:glycosyltransferase involved in cell wall biosynthesis
MIDVIITVYNCKKYLSNAINSVVLQTFREWHLIIFNDGSTDESLEIARNYQSMYSERITVIDSKHIGRANALIEAVKHCRYDYLAFLDSDDLLDSLALEITLKEMIDNPSLGMVYTNYCNIDQSGNNLGLGGRCFIPYSPNRLLIDFMTFHFRVIRKSIYDRVGGISANFPAAQDYDLCLKISEIALIEHMPAILYSYRDNPNGISRSKWELQLDCSRMAVEQALSRRRLPLRLVVAKDGRFSLHALQ